MSANARPDGHNHQAAMDQLHADVYRHHMAPFWAIDKKNKNDEDNQLRDTRKAIPFLWKYRTDIEPLLQRSAELINTESSERRSLILVNPGLAPKRASVSTMYTAYRLNDPNEIMPPHRHSPNAIRLGLTGALNFTGVEGENITFGPGDMVLTPHDTWHNHGNQGDEPAINLSVLDLPLVETLNAMYFEHDYTEEEEGKRVKRVMQSERYTPDYSQRVYGAGGLHAALRLAHARHRQRLADVCLSLGHDARGAGEVPRLRWRSVRSHHDRVCRPARRQAGVQDHHLLHADAAAGRAHAAARSRPPACWWRRSKATATA